MRMTGRFNDLTVRKYLMNLFEFFFKITHYRNIHAWDETVATFTGKSEAATVRTRFGPRKTDFNAYEIVYYANGQRKHGWYSFSPLPGPDAEELRGTKMKIRFMKRKPYIFEKVNIDVGPDAPYGKII